LIYILSYADNDNLNSFEINPIWVAKSSIRQNKCDTYLLIIFNNVYIV